jgi:hypothetical protein
MQSLCRWLAGLRHAPRHPMKRQIRPFQFLKRALANNLALLQQKDHITLPHRGQAMGNEDVSLKIRSTNIEIGPGSDPSNYLE